MSAYADQHALSSRRRGTTVFGRRGRGAHGIGLCCRRSETVHPQRRLYGPWKWRIPSSASLRAAKRCEAKVGRSRPGKPHSPAPSAWAPQQYRRGYDAPPVATRRSRVATPPLTATRDWLTPNPFDAARRDGFSPPRSATPRKRTGYLLRQVGACGRKPHPVEWRHLAMIKLHP